MSDSLQTLIEVLAKRARQRGFVTVGEIQQELEDIKAPAESFDQVADGLRSLDLHIEEDSEDVLDTQLADTRNAWEMGPEGRYEQRTPPKEATPGCQTRFIAQAESLHKQAVRMKRRRPAQIARRLRRIR